MNAFVDPTLRGDGKRAYPTRCIIYPDGRMIERQAKIPMEDITSIICDETDVRALTIVNLRDGHVMLVHDMGHQLLLPGNPGATAAYWGICVPGTTHEIRGTVVIVPDEDFD
jgi:hypothetical protein